MKRAFFSLGALLALTPPIHAEGFPVHIEVDAATSLGTLSPIWRFFGADEPNYATEPDGERLLTELGALRGGEVYFRAHNLLTSGDGKADFKWGSTNLYTEKSGKAVYDFHIVDGIIDTYLARGIHPYLEIGFMPEALTSAPSNVPYHRPWRPGQAYKDITTGWAYPPKDFERWGEIIYQWTRHNVERYGEKEVARWYFEVWNEANLDFYWQGTAEEFYRLHDVGIAAVRRALPTARVGGPDVAGAGGEFMRAFLKHITTGKNFADGSIGTPADFLSFHAKGQPSFIDGHVRMGIDKQLATVDEAFTLIAGTPPLADKPIVIGENDPEGCAACPGPQNAYRNGTLYSSYTAASYARLWELARTRHINLEGALTWAFTFPGQPWFAGYRQLATDGVDLPVLNVFRLFSRLGSEQISARSSAQLDLATIIREGVRNGPDVGALATRSRRGVAILLWHYHDDDVPGPEANVELSIRGAKSLGANATMWVVDKDHGNAFTEWQALGSPTSPTSAQIERLRRASVMKEQLVPVAQAGNEEAVLHLSLPRQAVELIELTGPPVRAILKHP
jgi:xylan 1,4-beta-xylosidase